MRNILRKYSLIGYHCTKLTASEIENVRVNGMLLQNSMSLNNRIERLKESGLITAKVTQLLKNKNQADDFNRANMLWFCFFEPFMAGRSGIERFFRYWGGEALYNSHEDCPNTSNVLLDIGIPCIIKAKVPIASLKGSYYPDSSMIRAFLLERGHQLENPIEHEGFSTKNIPSQNIIEIIEYPSDYFIKLTKCNEWDVGDATL
jgi:hypothetical protein